ncbi:hypothetical protein PIB30_021523 [Stylosanthes scabra]|uniref:Uncharacterized protein n=1 Tax=Stylosanthes scabra TaxID=79078 RepID=A0ABU6R957_9FABA|nr:hypothetical protein [Stylosanthes scabra]
MPTHQSSSLPFPGIITALCLEAKVVIRDDILIPQELPIVGETMERVREPKAKNPKAKQTRRLDSQQEESRKNFEALNTWMNRFDDQLSYLCYATQMTNEHMLSPYQDTTRLMREMEMQGIPVTMANLAIYRQKEEEMRQEKMRYDQIFQEAVAEKAKEENRGKAQVVEEEEDEDTDELASSASEE